MGDTPTIGLIVPTAAGEVPADGPKLYPEGVRFVAAGLGLQRLTPEGYDSVIDRVGALAGDLAGQGIQAIALMGTSLSFYKGHAFNEQLKATMRAATGLPATTMSTGVVEGLRALGVRRVAVGTAYIDEVNNRLRQFLRDSGFDVGAVQGLGIDMVGQARNVSEQDLVALGERVLAASPGADGILISCGGLRTLGVTVPLEAATGLPVVSSTPAAFWSAVRLVGHGGAAPGYGRLFELGAPTPSATTAS
ncbi:MAG TPA: aspartate/glutamate racemase family protein [Chloroflexota bacterium]|jgi:arylmalonate decarboxylase